MPAALERITPDRRCLDDDLAAAWRQAHPRLLGSLLTLTSAVLAVLPAVKLGSLPRMADFARVVAAVDSVLGTHALPAYLNLGTALAVEVIDADPVAASIRDHHATACGPVRPPTCSPRSPPPTPPPAARSASTGRPRRAG